MTHPYHSYHQHEEILLQLKNFEVFEILFQIFLCFHAQLNKDKDSDRIRHATLTEIYDEDCVEDLDGP